MGKRRERTVKEATTRNVKEKQPLQKHSFNNSSACKRSHLNEAAHGRPVGGDDVLVRVVDDVGALSLGEHGHGQVAVHFVAVKVRVVPVV